MDKDRIYQAYGDFVFKYLFSLAHDYHAAEELTQETFYQAIRSIHNYDKSRNAKFSTWLCAIAKNVWLQEINRENKKEKLVQSLGEENTSYNIEEEYIKNEDKIAFFHKAHQLDEVKREVIYLRLLGDLSFREIGTIFGKTENWARVTFYRAKQAIRKDE